MLVYLAMGSNLGDREAYFRAAAKALPRPRLKLIRSASLYETEPKERIDQPWFLNTVIEADTDIEAERLLDICLEVEQANGRIRDESNGPRTLDLDIILYGSSIFTTPRLVVPHPRYTNRRFVLEPLAEIIPNTIDPVRQRTIRELLAASTDSSVVRKTGPPLLL